MYIKEVCKIFENKNPYPKAELEYINEWTFAVAVILSAQSTDKRVNIVMKGLTPVASTPEDFLKLGLDGLIPYIKSLNYFNNKGKNIIKLAEVIQNKFGGKLPRTKSELIELPGIGVKTAGVIINQLWGGDEIPVDTHVFRVAHRLGWVNDSINTPEKTGVELGKIIPTEYKKNISNWLVLHGRYICDAKKPKCEICELAQHCKWYKENK